MVQRGACFAKPSNGRDGEIRPTNDRLRPEGAHTCVNTDDDRQPNRLLIGFLVALAYSLAQAAAPALWQLWFELVQAILSQ